MKVINLQTIVESSRRALSTSVSPASCPTETTSIADIDSKAATALQNQDALLSKYKSHKTLDEEFKEVTQYRKTCTSSCEKTEGD